MGIAAKYKRWRHSQGFGIHSPSAYNLIREVLCPSSRYGFYAYQDILNMRPTYFSIYELMLIFRLLVEYKPKTICCHGKSDLDILRDIARLASHDANIVADDSDAEMIIYGDIKGRHIALPENEVVKIYFNEAPPNLIDLFTSLTCGHIFHGKNHVLINKNPSLPAQIFTLNF